jgi:hypothetical protein
MLAVGLLGAATPTSAAIYNVAATDNVGVTIQTVFGTNYKFEWIGTAQGGLYDAAKVSFCPLGVCTTGWSNALSQFDTFDPPSDFDIELITIPGPAPLPTFSLPIFASAAESIAAYRGSGVIYSWNTRVLNGVRLPIGFDGSDTNPAIFTPDQTGLIRIVVADGDGDRSNNLGGVSFRVTEVPEPTTWAMLIMGLGGVGAALRKRRRPAFA